MKGLQKIERIKKLSCVWDAENDEFKDAVEIVPNAFKTIEKELKALKIIKEKEVDIKAFNDLQDLQDYNYYCSPELTQEEYDLLKEVLKNE